jgi:hypothetical protein
MKMRIRLIIENESGVTTTTQIAGLERRGSDDLIGSLEEAKSVTGSVQRALVECQARDPSCCDVSALSDAASPKRLAPGELPHALRPLGPG